MKSTAEIVWIYCDKKTLEPVKTVANGKIHVHSKKPSLTMMRSAEHQHRKNLTLKRGFLVFVDEDSPQPSIKQPPCNNRYVADGCEKFST